MQQKFFFANILMENRKHMKLKTFELFRRNFLFFKAIKKMEQLLY